MRVTKKQLCLTYTLDSLECDYTISLSPTLCLSLFLSLSLPLLSLSLTHTYPCHRIFFMIFCTFVMLPIYSEDVILKIFSV